MLPDYMPDEKTLKKRREPKFVIDPKDVVATDDIRVRQWALAIMQKHTSRLSDEVPDKQIVFEKEVEPEDIDIVIFNSLGKEIKRIINVSEEQYNIDLVAYPKGIYFVELSSNKGTAVKKIIKQ